MSFATSAPPCLPESAGEMALQAVLRVCGLMPVTKTSPTMTLALCGQPFSFYAQKAFIPLQENETPFEFRTLDPGTTEQVHEIMSLLNDVPRRGASDLTGADAI